MWGLLLAAIVLVNAPAAALTQPSFLWLDDDGRPTAALADARAMIERAGDDGLDPCDYVLPPAPASTDAGARAQFDRAVSAGVLRFLRDLHSGRIDPARVGFRVGAGPARGDVAALLASALRAGRLTELRDQLRPSFDQYRLLRAELARYRALAADGSVQAPPFEAKTVRPGDVFGALPQLLRYLRATGDLARDPSAAGGLDRYSGDAVDAVRRFQTRHGLEPDGVLGKQTIAALHVPMARRVRQIELSLERLRWVPPPTSRRVVALNIPMFRVWAWDQEQPADALSMRAIVGRAPGRQTPVLSGEIREVVLRPYWNVPRSILMGEILRRIERDPDAVWREGFEIVRGEGDDGQIVPFSAEAIDGLRRGTLRIRQRPGPNNALGLIKLALTNAGSIYMHGTPQPALFSASRRDFSHGCVRVADPAALAAWLLQDSPEWNSERILAATGGAETVHVPVSGSVQMLLFYTTAAVMPDGSLYFADDIYAHDARLERALAAPDGY